MQVWIPLAHSDDHQAVRVIESIGNLPLKQTRDKEYGNAMLYASTPRAEKPEYRFTVRYDVLRREHVVLTDGHPIGGKAERSPRPLLARFLQPDKLVPITGLPAQLATTETQGRTTPLDRAHAIYDYVFRTMRYDKSGTGWGRGDTLWACDSKRGNCTDFHSLFISMARSQGIPARFEIGFALPIDKKSPEVAGYHCWSEFYLDQIGWVPIDISQAWQRPEKKRYFFGAHDENRIQFTMGRDLQLNPPQQGEPLNYFVYPYVEMAGKNYSNIALNFSFADAEETKQTQGTR